MLEERDEQLVRLAEPSRCGRIEHERLVRQLVDRLLALEQRPQRLQARIGHVRGPRNEHVAATVEHADHRSVDLEQLDRGSGHRIERRVEREALREGARDLVERPQPLPRLPLGGDRLLKLRRLPLRALVELRVLRRHRQLGGQRRQERRVARLHLPPARQVDREQSHELLARDERDGERRVDPRFRHSGAHRSEPRVGLGIHDVQDALRAERTERELEQALGDRELRIGARALLRS